MKDTFVIRLRVEPEGQPPTTLLQELPRSVLPTAWFERSQVLMGLWRAGALTLAEAWRLL